VRIRKSVAIGTVTAVMGLASAALVALPASAQTTPPWEPDVDALGTLTFYNSAGQVVTSGTNLSHLFDFAEASTTDPDAGTKATLYFADPTPGEPTGDWFNQIYSTATPFPNASAPAPLNTSTDPVVSLAATDADLSEFIAASQENTASGYANVYQIRVATSGPGGVGTAPLGQYWDADVVVNPTAGTWQEEYPNEGTTVTSTTTTLTASPTGSALQGTPVTLTATEAPAAAGTVEFDQIVGGDTSNPTEIGSATVDATTGVATLTTSTILPSAPSGANSATIVATFTPTDTATFSGSSSGGLPYTVNPVANKPTISGKHQVGQSETCSDGTLDFGVTASYTWLASGKKIGTGAKITVPASAYNKQLTCQASVSDGGGPSNTATSSSVKVSLGAALKATKKPTLSGSHKVGKTETVKAGTWSVKGAKFSYQWLLNGKVIKHATKSTFKPTKGDKGKKLSCRVTAKVSGYANGTATTSSVKVSG
jgi:hypothetical protein